jgi:hypothetical protein
MYENNIMKLTKTCEEGERGVKKSNIDGII